MFGKGNSIGSEFAFKPIVSIHINLYLHGKPCLQLYVYQTEFPVHEVEVNEQAFPSGRLQKRTALLKLEGKSPTWFQHRENADKASLNLFFLGHLSRKVFFSSRNRQILNRTAELVCHCFGMLIDPVGAVGEKVLQIPEHYMILIQELGHCTAGLDRQVSTKEHSIKTTQCSIDLFLMFAYK